MVNKDYHCGSQRRYTGLKVASGKFLFVPAETFAVVCIGVEAALFALWAQYSDNNDDNDDDLDCTLVLELIIGKITFNLFCGWTRQWSTSTGRGRSNKRV